jgi:hypothetical protein
MDALDVKITLDMATENVALMEKLGIATEDDYDELVHLKMLFDKLNK